MNTTPTALGMEENDQERVVGADRVLAVLSELSKHAEGIALDDMAKAVSGSKPTVHRALASLRKAGLASQDSRGHYSLGDEFLRMAYTFHEARPDHLRVQPILNRLAARFGETAHFAILQGDSVFYRAKVDPVSGAMKLTSTIGGRNPAHATAVGKLLLSYVLQDRDAISAWIGRRVLEHPTPNTLTDLDELEDEFVRIRQQGFSIDNQENEPGVNCIALPIFFGSPSMPAGAVSISALAHRTPLQSLVNSLPLIQAIVSGPDEATDS